jgi:hypothetical protein
MNKTSSQTIVEIPAGGFYVHDTTNPNILPYSDGAFGCCYLTIEDPISKKTLIAHINAQTVMFEPIADKTVQNMLAEFKKQGGDISKSKVTIVHSNKFAEYEKAQAEKTESFKLTNSYKEKTEDNMAMEPFANEFLQKALVRADVKNIQVIEGFNSNLVDFVANPMVGTKKTDICFVDGKIHLQNYHSNQCPSKEEWQKPENERDWSLWKSEVKEHTGSSGRAFEKVSLAQKNGTAITIPGGDWKSVHNFYLRLREGLDTGQVKQDGTKFDFSETATREFKEKMNSPQFVAVNMNNVVKEHLQNHLKQSTISSLLKEGNDVLPQISSTFKNKQGEMITMSNRKQDKSFVEALKEKREKEAESSKEQSR